MSDQTPKPIDLSDFAGNWWAQWNPDNITLTSTEVDKAWKICVLKGTYFHDDEEPENLGGRISAIFVILVTSLIGTLFPILAAHVKRLRVPRIVYEFARYFGSGVILATGFIHLMDPAYGSIGPASCVGSTGNWSIYAWCPAIMLTSSVATFIIDTYCNYFAKEWFGVEEDHQAMEDYNPRNAVHCHTHSGDANADFDKKSTDEAVLKTHEEESSMTSASKFDFSSQFAGLLILEFGIIFHSVMIGLTLGSSDEYAVLYPVLVFHQMFEGLGLGSRMSMIDWPRKMKWWPYIFAVAYSVATPIAVAIGIGVRHTYRDDGYTTSVVSGVLNAISAGILLYTAFVEFLARDFIIGQKVHRSVHRLTLHIVFLLWGAGLMALLGKWA